jgi:hypothetical protein
MNLDLICFWGSYWILGMGFVYLVYRWNQRS